LAVPRKPTVSGLVDGQIIITLNQDWKPEGQSTTFLQGLYSFRST
jgi:hypothetical protein